MCINNFRKISLWNNVPTIVNLSLRKLSTVSCWLLWGLLLHSDFSWFCLLLFLLFWLVLFFLLHSDSCWLLSWLVSFDCRLSLLLCFWRWLFGFLGSWFGFGWWTCNCCLLLLSHLFSLVFRFSNRLGTLLFFFFLLFLLGFFTARFCFNLLLVLLFLIVWSKKTESSKCSECYNSNPESWGWEHVRRRVNLLHFYF